MKKYCEKDYLNNDQAKLIMEKGWSFYTECCESPSSSYYVRGYAPVNRIGYIIISDRLEESVIESNSDLQKIAQYDYEFEKEVKELLQPIEDKCYVFLIRKTAHYYPEQVWTNKGLDFAKKIAKAKWGNYNPKYYDSDSIESLRRLMISHNKRIDEQTEEAKKLLKENGFDILSSSFAVMKRKIG